MICYMNSLLITRTILLTIEIIFQETCFEHYLCCAFILLYILEASRGRKILNFINDVKRGGYKRAKRKGLWERSSWESAEVKQHTFLTQHSDLAKFVFSVRAYVLHLSFF